MTSSGTPRRAHPPDPRPQSSHTQPENQWGADAAYVGLARYLNSQTVDTYFRTFSGHTQVNATDLRNLFYPSLAQLEALAGTKDVDRAIAGFAG
jgi:hypothetical protein